MVGSKQSAGRYQYLTPHFCDHCRAGAHLDTHIGMAQAQGCAWTGQDCTGGRRPVCSTGDCWWADCPVVQTGICRRAALATKQWRAALQGQEVGAADEAEEAQTVEPKKELGPVQQTIANYIDLMKPHVTVLLLGTTAAAMAIAYQGLPPLGLVAATLLGGAMAAGSANCINCYIDRDIDQIMGRTQRRSLPAGRVQPRQALIFGIVLGVGSFVILAVFVNLLSAVLAGAAIIFYVFVYTLGLKRTSTQNIVIGGAAGAVPVLVGWAAITNNLSMPAIWLF